MAKRSAAGPRIVPTPDSDPVRKGPPLPAAWPIHAPKTGRSHRIVQSDLQVRFARVAAVRRKTEIPARASTIPGSNPFDPERAHHESGKQPGVTWSRDALLARPQMQSHSQTERSTTCGHQSSTNPPVLHLSGDGDIVDSQRPTTRTPHRPAPRPSAALLWDSCFQNHRTHLCRYRQPAGQRLWERNFRVQAPAAKNQGQCDSWSRLTNSRCEPVRDPDIEQLAQSSRDADRYTKSESLELRTSPSVPRPSHNAPEPRGVPRPGT